MSEIVQLYKDEQKTTKVYPKTVATEVYIDENTTVASQLEQNESYFLSLKKSNNYKLMKEGV